MTVPAGNSRSPPPLLLGALLLATLGFAAVAVGLGQMDIASLVGRRITQARGTMSPATVAWLQEFPFAGWAWAAAAGCGFTALGVWRAYPAWRRWVGSARGERTPAGDPRWTVVLSVLAVASCYPLTLPHGFFRYDDFDLISLAHREDAWTGFWTPHGDHFLPLTRLITSTAYALWGVTAWPYNLGVLAIMAAIAALGCQLLAQFGANRGAQFVFLALVVLWSPWAEIMTGYYILSSYTLIVALGLAAVGWQRRWQLTRRPAYAWGVAGCTLAATLLDISGWWVPAALGVFLAVDYVAETPPRAPGAWFARHRPLLLAVAGVCAASLAATFYSYAVVNRGLFLSMGGGGPRSIVRLATEFLYLFDVGLLVSLVTPFVYARLPLALLAILGATVLAAWLVFMAGAWRRSIRGQRLNLLAVALVLAGTGLMVNLGRPAEETVIVRWAAKHVGPAFVWLCLLLALGWQAWWARMDARGRVLMAEATLVVLGLYGISQFTFAQLGRAVSFPPFGYPAEIRDARDRRAALEEIADRVVAPLARAAGPGGITAPTLDGPFLARRCPGLYEYNLGTYLPFFGAAVARITFVRTPAMHPWQAPGVTTVPSLRSAVSPEFLALLARDAALRDFYFGRVPLRWAPATAPLPANPAGAVALTADGKPLPSEPDGAARLVSDGTGTAWLRRDAFDPEEIFQLRLAIGRRDSSTASSITFEVRFSSDLAGPDAGGSLTFPVGSSPGTTIEVDLRQLYAFALSSQVRDLRLVFSTPGDYRVRGAVTRP